MKANDGSTYKFNKAIDEDSLLNLYGSDLDYIMQMFGVYLGMIDEELTRLKDACSSNDRELVRQVAHKLKPVFLMVGLLDLNVMSKEIEFNHDVEDFTSLHGMIEKFEKRISQTSPILTSEIERIKSILNTKK